MNGPTSVMAQQIGQAASAAEQRRTGHTPKSVNVILNGDTLVVTLRDALSPAELELARQPAGAAQLQEFHRELFGNSSAELRQEIKRITGVEVRESGVQIELTTGAIMQMFATGTVVLVFLLAGTVPVAAWNGVGADPS